MTLVFLVLQHGFRPFPPGGMEAPVEESIAHQAGTDAA